MKHLRTSLRTLSPGLIALLTTVSLAACGDDEQGVVANVEVLIYGPNDSRPGGSCEAQGAICGFPAGVLAAAQGGAVVVTVFEGEERIAESITRFDRYAATLPPVEFGPNRWISVELIDQLGFTATTRVLASGATQIFEATPEGVDEPLRIYTAPSQAFTPAFYFDDFEERSVEATFDGGRRAGFAQTVLDDSGIVVVAGGANVEFDGASFSFSDYSDTIEVYDPRLGRWLLVTQPGCDISAGVEPCAVRLDNPAAFLTATAVSATEVVLVGGMNDADGFEAPVNQAMLLSFSYFDELAAEATITPLARTGQGPGVADRAMHSATRMSDGRVVVAGGFRGTYQNPTMVTIVDEIRVSGGTGSYVPTGSQIAIPRALHTATHIDEGAHGVLLAGGRDDSGVVSASEVIYLSDTGELQYDIVPDVGTSIDLAVPRFGHVAVPYRCGAGTQTFVALVGGYTQTADGGLLNGAAPTDLVEIYDPTGITLRGSYEFIRDDALKLGSARAFPTAAPLRASGGLVVGGGIGADGTVLATAERLLNRNQSDCAVFTNTAEAFVVPVAGGLGSARALAGAAEYESHFAHFFGGVGTGGSLASGVFFNPDDYASY